MTTRRKRDRTATYRREAAKRRIRLVVPPKVILCEAGDCRRVATVHLGPLSICTECDEGIKVSEE